MMTVAAAARRRLGAGVAVAYELTLSTTHAGAVAQKLSALDTAGWDAAIATAADGAAVFSGVATVAVDTIATEKIKSGDDGDLGFLGSLSLRVVVGAVVLAIVVVLACAAVAVTVARRRAVPRQKSVRNLAYDDAHTRQKSTFFGVAPSKKKKAAASPAKKAAKVELKPTTPKPTKKKAEKPAPAWEKRFDPNHKVPRRRFFFFFFCAALATAVVGALLLQRDDQGLVVDEARGLRARGGVLEPRADVPSEAARAFGPTVPISWLSRGRFSRGAGRGRRGRRPALG